MEQKCLFCSSKISRPSYLPSTTFNNRKFDYVQCNDCDLIYLHPFPSAEEYLKMYPPSYQMGVLDTIIERDKKLPGLRYSYTKQFKLIDKFAKGKHILDYGCGHCNFLVNARHEGYKCDGAEFNEEHLVILRENIKDSTFYSIDEILNSSSNKFEVIHLSNVLEHLENPLIVLDKLKKNLSNDGIILIEGPIETNFSLAFLNRYIYFFLAKKLKPNRLVKHSPTHIFFSNSKNQKHFFEKSGFDLLYFEVKDLEWPYPETFSDVDGFGGLVKFLIAKISRVVSFGVKGWGNTFIYVGRLKS